MIIDDNSFDRQTLRKAQQNDNTSKQEKKKKLKPKKLPKKNGLGFNKFNNY